MSPPHQPPGPAAPDQGGSYFDPGMSAPPTLSVLCAEDDPDIAAVVQIALEISGHRVAVVNNGQLALDRIQANPTAYDVILTDHDMPVMDGLGLTTHLRAGRHAVGVVVHSASLGMRDWQLYQDLGVTEFLSKPCELARLLAALHRAARQPLTARLVHSQLHAPSPEP